MPMGKPDDPIAKSFLEGLVWNNENWQDADETDKFFWDARKPFASIEVKPAEVEANVEKMDADEEEQVAEEDAAEGEKPTPPTIGKKRLDFFD